MNGYMSGVGVTCCGVEIRGSFMQQPWSHVQWTRHLPVRPNRSYSLLMSAELGVIATAICDVESVIGVPDNWRIEGGKLGRRLRAENLEVVVE